MSEWRFDTGHIVRDEGNDRFIYAHNGDDRLFSAAFGDDYSETSIWSGRVCSDIPDDGGDGNDTITTMNPDDECHIFSA